MLVGLGAGLLALAAVLSLRWARARRDALGRPRPFPAISVGLCLLLGLGSSVQVLRHARTEHQLNAAASAVAGASVTVHCQTVGQAAVDPGPELGYVEFGADGVPEHHALIKWEQCRQIARWLHSNRTHPSREEVVAVHVLTHETMHMTGTRDEAVTECQAMQRDTAMAERLGTDPRDAHALAIAYWLQVYPLMPDGYRTADCAPGGPLDEHLPNPPWTEPRPPG